MAASKNHSNSQHLSNLREGNCFAEELIALKKGEDVRRPKYSAGYILVLGSDY